MFIQQNLFLCLQISENNLVEGLVRLLDDDVVEEIASISTWKTSIVWTYFEEIPQLDPTNPTIWAKCKFCSVKYVANSSHGTRNLKRHIDVCGKKNTHDVKQLLLSQN